MTSTTSALPGTARGGDVLVELPSLEVAERLCERLGPDQGTQPEQEENHWVVDLTFENAKGLARLLRTVEAWVAERALGAVRYRLDGKAYILAAGEIAWSSFGREPAL